MTDKFVSRPGGGERTRLCSLPCGEVLVDIRYGDGVTRLSDLDHIHTAGEIEIVVLDSIERVAEQLRARSEKLNSGDALIVFVANEAVYSAAVNTLKIGASG
ncbi:hypothetical protein G3N59_00460 [Paraburkholderia sp. Ac-20340]|uniref:hypothetical protein n=1 Tax=Paraburkholderia sp. Ac-20340 TaxID=2703888 RepID=UPI001980A669|nr:hypothetical protein [Paraburkholderia sp. Ac-20340]MBN3851836.1 hypothetical protein [Paraburkholderia sp. Ac-20340]